MATAVTHALVGAALGQAATPELRQRPSYWLIVVFCSIAPDFDVVGHRLGVPYHYMWGHRGLTHSLLFAAALAAVFALWLQKKAHERLQLALLLFVVTASHGVLDALTNGGLGVAFFAPVSRRRYFFPWRPIHVAPLGGHALFTSHAMRVLGSEMWVWGPALAVVLMVPWLREVKAGRLHARASQKIG